MKTIRKARLLPAVFATLILTTACGGALKPKEVKESRHQLSDAYGGTLDATSALVIADNRIVAIQTIPKAEADAAVDPALTAFTSGLYPKLKEHCGGCHGGQNDVPFASPGIDLAFATAKKYVTSDGEQSQMIINIRASHNGVDPAWADDMVPLVEAVANAATN